MLKKFPSDEINGTKHAHFFLLGDQTQHSFTFTLRFSYELKHEDQGSFSKTVGEVFQFRFRFIFLTVYIFVQQNPWSLWLWNVIVAFKIKIIEKPSTVFFPAIWFLSCNKTIQNSMVSAWVGSAQKPIWRQIFWI